MKELLTAHPIEKRLRAWHGEPWHTFQGRIIRDVVYALDTGLVTTTGFLAGVSLSLKTASVILVAGLAQITAGMVAIFFGSYISTKAQKEFFEGQIRRETREIEENPKKETEEIREIFREMGFAEDELNIAVRRITADKKTWLKFMIQEEIGVVPGTLDDPLSIGLVSAGSFLVGTVAPILPFALGFHPTRAMPMATLAVVVFLFVIGVTKTKLTRAHWLLSGVETMAFGLISCGIGFGLGQVANRVLGGR